MRVTVLTPVFVEYVPEKLVDGKLYLSVEFATAVHNCCCGCGNQVVTPFTPTDWRLIFDGVSVSLEPSIGNWSFPCRSHYWVTNNNIRWAGQWSQTQIDSGRAFDRASKADPYGDPASETLPTAPSTSTPGEAPRGGLWARFKAWLGLG